MKKKLADANISKEHIEQLEADVQKLKNEVAAAREKLDTVEAKVTSTMQEVDFAQEDLKKLKEEGDKIEELSNELNEKANKIKEADVQGAYNITKEAAAESLNSQQRVDAMLASINNAEVESQAAQDLMDQHKDDFDKQYSENQNALGELEKNLHGLENSLPRLNGEVCGAVAAPCDSLCGGPGSCGFCGGKSCLEGAVSKAEQAKSFALEADLRLNEKQTEAENVLTLVRDVHQWTETAKKDAEKALEVAREAAKQANATRSQLDEVLQEMNAFLKGSRSSPEQIRTLAEEVLNMKISLTPEQITELTTKIRESLAKINNISDILAETRGNKTIAADLESKALEASNRAATIKNTTDTVREALLVATEAQAVATDAIRSAEETMKLAREDLEKAREETTATEEAAKQANATLTQLEGEVKKVKVSRNHPRKRVP